MTSNSSVTKLQGGKLHISVPIEKVDTAQRRVSGWASMDNLDEHNDIILAEANRKAFENFRGNIREQHTPLAVGKMVDFREDTYYDTKSGEMYNGIFVTVYISKGAQDTWEKVLDGTLSGFSIGGDIVDSEQVFNKDINSTVRVVKDYRLFELSLVDNPANQMANIFAIQKSADGVETMEGIATNTLAEDIFYCEEDGISKTSTDATINCPTCGKPMENIGWFEYDSSNKLTKLKDAINEHIAGKRVSEGGVIMGNTNTTVTKSNTATDVVVETPAEEGIVNDEGTASVEDAPSNEPVVEIVETSTEDEDKIEAMIAGLRDAITAKLDENSGLVSKSIEGVQQMVGDIETNLRKAYEELAVKHEELATRFVTIEETIGTVESSISEVKKSAAFKKSGDLGGSSEEAPKEKSFWGGGFLGLDDL